MSRKEEFKTLKEKVQNKSDHAFNLFEKIDNSLEEYQKNVLDPDIYNNDKIMFSKTLSVNNIYGLKKLCIQYDIIIGALQDIINKSGGIETPRTKMIKEYNIVEEKILKQLSPLQNTLAKLSDKNMSLQKHLDFLTIWEKYRKDELDETAPGYDMLMNEMDAYKYVEFLKQWDKFKEIEKKHENNPGTVPLPQPPSIPLKDEEVFNLKIYIKRDLKERIAFFEQCINVLNLCI